MMANYLEIAEQNQCRAKGVIENLRIEALLKEARAQINLVGSLKKIAETPDDKKIWEKNNTMQ